METTKPRNPSLNLKAAVDELLRGRGLASQLGAILEEALPTSTDQDLLRMVSDSFSRALVALDTRSLHNNGGGGGGGGGDEQKSVWGKKRKLESGQRGGGRLRRVSPCKSITTTTLNDGHSWRKYGQKAILNYKSPRGYYRCTHKKDQKCLATRRVQQSEENPSLFVITYTGEHTCREALTDPSASLGTGPCVIDFSCCGSSATTTTTVSDQESISTSENQESDEQVVSDVLALERSPGSSSPLEQPPRLAEEQMGGASVVSEHSNVVTSWLQPSSLGDLRWDLMYEDSFDINCIFDYNQGGTLYE